MAAHAQGLDPALGFLHALVPGRSALALDVLEVARPGVDAIVVGLLCSSRLTASDFRLEGGGCLMQKPARIALMEAFAEARSHWPGQSGSLNERLRQATRDVARCIDSNRPEGEGDANPID